MPASVSATSGMDSLHENFALIVPYYAQAFKITEGECAALEAEAAERFSQQRAASRWAAVKCVVDAIDAFCTCRRQPVGSPGSPQTVGREQRKAA